MMVNTNSNKQKIPGNKATLCLPCEHYSVNIAIYVDLRVSLICFAERVMKIMDYEQGSFQDYTGHDDSVTNVLFSPCGRFLVSTSSSTVHIWNVVVQ